MTDTGSSTATPDVTRERLLAGAAEAITDRGIRGLRVQDIARAAKVSLRTFYEHFENKEECLSELWVVVTDQLLHVLQRPNEGMSWPDDIDERARRYLSSVASRPELMHAVLAEGSALGQELSMARRRALELTAQRLSEVVDLYRADNPDQGVRPLSFPAALAVVAGLAELILKEIEEGNAERLPDLAPFVGDFVWSAVTGPARPRE